MFQSWEIKSLTETIPGEVQILELLVKDVTVSVLNVNQLKETMNKEPPPQTPTPHAGPQEDPLLPKPQINFVTLLKLAF